MQVYPTPPFNMKKPISISPNPIVFIDKNNVRSLGLEVSYTDNSTDYIKLIDVNEIREIRKKINKIGLGINFGYKVIEPLIWGVIDVWKSTNKN